MAIVVTCPSCKAKLKAPEALVGKKVKCPGCQTAVVVPDPAAVAAPPPPAPAPKPPAPVKQKVEEEEIIDTFDDLDEPAPAPVKGKAKKPAPVEDEGGFDDLDEPAPVKSKAKKPAPIDDENLDDLDDEPAPAKGKGKVKKAARDDDDFDDEDDDRRVTKRGRKAVAGEGKNWMTTLLLSIFLGGLGVDRFYLGYTGLGVVKLLTCGGCGILGIYDIIMIAMEKLPDASGNPLVK